MRKEFHSELLRRTVTRKESDFQIYLIAELVYRIYDREKKNCSCSHCKQEILKYKNYLANVREKYKL